MKTSVVFRKFNKFSNDIIALFPYDYEGDYMCSSYMHLGQHSRADYHYCIAISQPATYDEYHDLKRELESIGYDLKVIKKAVRSKMYK